MENIVTSRPAGLLETYFVVRSALDLYRSVCVWTVLTVPLNKPRLYAALARMSSSHPALRAVVLDSTTKVPRIGYLQELNLDDIVEYVETDEPFEQFLETLHATKFDYEKYAPLWKLIVYNKTTYAFVFDHAPFDGTSGAIFHKDLLEHVNSDMLDDGNAVVKFDSQDTHASLEAVLNTSPSLSYVVKKLWSEFGPRSKSSTRDENLFAPYNREITGKHFRIYTIPKPQADAILAECRRHGTTLTAFLVTCLLAALTKTFPHAPGFDLSVPISARRFMSQADSLMGPYVLQHGEVIPAQSFSWEEAQRFAGSLKQGTTLKAGYIIGMLKYLFGNVAGWMTGKLGQPRDRDMEISNLGAHRFASGKYEVEKFGFSQPVGVLNPPVVLSCAGITGGPVTLTLLYSDSLVGDGCGGKIFEELCSLLTSIVQEPPTKDA